MKILFTSYVFSPSLGGIETVSALLAPEFVKAGHEVKLVTKTRARDQRHRPYEVVRAPSFSALKELIEWSDVVFQNNISLELAWPLLFKRRPWIVVHQTWLHHGREGTDGTAWRGALKMRLLRFARNISISQPIADSLPVSSTIVGNPYSPELFRSWPETARDRDLVFLGRLVSDKGVDLLLDALAELQRRGLTPHLTVIGSGPEKDALRERAARQFGGQVEFIGVKMGAELAQLLNAHRIMVVPSRWVEPFGIVALEGIACGCTVVAARIGGLPEAVGPCGILFEPGNALALADALATALRPSADNGALRPEVQTHLARFTPGQVAKQYLRIFEEELEKSPGRKQ